MRFLVITLLLAACGGAAPDASNSADLNGECHGLKPAHCFCEVLAGPVFTTGSPDGINDPGIDGQHLFTYVIPGKCYSQQADLWNSHLDGGCWLDCRNAFGVDGHAVDPGVTQARLDARQELFALGACGSGWMSAPLNYAAGTNKYRSATGSGIGIGLMGQVVTVNGKKECR